MFLSWLFLIPFSHAESTPAPLRPIHVKAKRPTPSKSVTTSKPFRLADADFSQGQYRQLSDALATTSSLAVVNSGHLGQQTSIFSRGLATNHLQVRQDGMRLNSPIDASGAFDFSNSNTGGLADVHLTRGVLSSFYGSNSLGGVLELKSQVGQDDFHQTALIETGSHRTVRGRLGLKGASQGAHLTIVGDKLTTAGYHQTPSSFKKSGVSYPRLPYQLDALTVTGGWRNEKVEVTLFNRFSDSFTRYQGFDRTKPLERKQSYHRLQMTTKGNPSWQHTLGGGVSVDHLVNARNFNTYNKSDGQRLQVDWRQTIALSANHKLDILVEGSGDKLIVNMGNVRNHQTQRQLAGALYYQGLFGAFTLEAALRGEHNNRFKSPLTGGIGGAYQLTSSTKVFTNIATTFRAPSLYELYGRSGNFVGNPHLKPEQGHGFEAGIEQVLSKTLTLESTYFLYRVRRLIETRPDFSTFENHHKMRSTGLDSSLTWQALSNLLIRIGHCYTRAQDYKGQPLLRRPNHKIIINATYSKEAFTFTTELQGIGKRYDYNPKQYARAKAKPYMMLNLKMGYTCNKHWQLFARVDNLFNKTIEDPISFRKAGLSTYVGLSSTY